MFPMNFPWYRLGEPPDHVPDHVMREGSDLDAKNTQGDQSDSIGAVWLWVLFLFEYGILFLLIELLHWRLSSPF
jgi:hypothetical protein